MIVVKDIMIFMNEKPRTVRQGTKEGCIVKKKKKYGHIRINN